MQQRPDPEKHLLRLVERLVEPAGGHRHGSGLARLGQRHDRPDRRDVTERPRRLLHIRLELVNRVIEAPVALGDQTEQRLDRRLTPDRRGTMDEGVESLENTQVARQKTGVDERDEKLRVVRLAQLELTELAYLVPHLEAQVPERVQQPFDETLLGGVDRAAKQDQQVDVRVETEVTPAIPADRHQCGRGLGLGGGLRVDPRQQGIDPGSEGLCRGRTTPRQLDFGAVFVVRCSKSLGEGALTGRRSVGVLGGHRHGLVH